MTLPNELHPGFLASAGGDLGEPIPQSLRFSGAQYLSRAGVLAAESTTFSAWIKIGKVSVDSIPLSHSGGSGINQLIFNATGTISADNTVAQNCTTSSVYRDPGAWFHLVYTRGATNTRLFVNGAETPYSVNASGSGGTITSPTLPLTIGTVNSANSLWFDGYMADIHFIDGQQLLPTSFGKYNVDNIWVPQNYSGAYGSNGFHLTLDSSQANGIGHDSSGNNNHFTANGFDTGDIALYNADVYGDTSTTYDNTNTNKVFLNSGQYGPSRMFDGDLVNNACKSGTGQAQTWIYWRPSGGLSISSSLVVHCSNTADVRINGTSTGQTNDGTASNFPITIANPPSTLTELAIQGNSISSATIYGVVVDGVTLVNNTDTDVDYFDTPTSNYSTLTPLNKKTSSTYTISNGNLKISSASSGYINTQSSMPASDFNCYCEVTVIAKNLNGIGVGDNTAAIATGAGSYVTYREDGTIIQYPGNTTLGTVATYDAGDVLGMIISSTNVAFYKNGTFQGSYSHSQTGDFYVIGMVYYSSGAATMDFNFGQMPFLYTVPTGFKALQTNNLTEPTIKNGSDHFQTLIGGGAGTFKYASESTTKTTEAIDFSELDQFTPTSTDVSGRSFILDTLEAVTSVSFTITNGWGWSGQTATIRVSATGAASSWTTTTSTQTMENNETVTVSNGSAFRYIRIYHNGGTVNFGEITTTNQALLSRAQSTFANGLYWIKDRQNSNQHQLVDTVRGVSLASQCPGSSKNQAYAAPSGNSVAWCWKSGSPAVNGFNIVEYTGNASSTQAIAHGLPSTPEWIITASQGSSPGGFETYHVACSSGQSVTIDAPRAQAASSRYNAVDATNITYGGDYNTDGQSMIFYAWTSVEGYSKFGSYESNVQNDGPYVCLGFKPSLVILKSVDESTSASWKFADATREPYNLGTGIRLVAVSQDAETVHSNETIDFLSNGFKIRGTSNSQNAPNVNKTFLYCAFAESPFGGENVAPATSR